MKKIELLKYLLLFIVSFSLFSYLQISPTFPDPDSFYHAKMAVLIRDQGIVHDFPWLQFTVLKNYYIDHHFLYHIALVPFITFLDPLVGIKLATAFFGAILMLVFYWLLQKFQIKGAFFYSLVLLTTSPFIFRINLAKASSVSLIILLFGLYFIFNRKLWQLFALSFVYVWTYGGWPLILVLTSLYILANSIIKTLNYLSNQKLKIKIKNSKFKIFYFIENCKLKIESLFKNFFSKENLKLFSSCFFGLTAGVIINPYFPKNLIFYWHQIIEIAVINYQNKIGVGAEWYPYNFGDLIANDSFIFVLLIITFAIFFVNFIQYFAERTKKPTTNAKQRTFVLASTFFMLFFLALTLRSRRNVEYFVPFAVILAAFTLNQPFSFFNHYWLTFKNWWKKRRVLTIALFFYFLIIIPLTVGQNLLSLKQLFASGYPLTKYKGVSEWLAKNTPEKSIIFHNDWDDFPPLFYYNIHNYYIDGLDPTFMYDYNKDLYQKWVDITTGRQENISEIVSNDFGAEYVFVDKDHPFLENNLKRDGHFKIVYQDDDGKIYQLSGDYGD